MREKEQSASIPEIVPESRERFLTRLKKTMKRQ